MLPASSTDSVLPTRVRSTPSEAAASRSRRTSSAGSASEKLLCTSRTPLTRAIAAITASVAWLSACRSLPRMPILTGLPPGPCWPSSCTESSSMPATRCALLRAADISWNRSRWRDCLSPTSMVSCASLRPAPKRPPPILLSTVFTSGMLRSCASTSRALAAVYSSVEPGAVLNDRRKSPLSARGRNSPPITGTSMKLPTVSTSAVASTVLRCASAQRITRT
ncbi:hypothetical protein D3C72_1519380 [compost metagenome]